VYDKPVIASVSKTTSIHLFVACDGQSVIEPGAQIALCISVAYASCGKSKILLLLRMEVPSR